MKIEIYRKRNDIEDDYPQTVFENVSAIEIRQHYIFGNINGEQLTIKTDHINYNYHII